MTQVATAGAEEAASGAASRADSGRRISHLKTLRALVRGKNISETTLLATDYLNHFNEIIMMIELVPTMPDCFEDAKNWQPLSYSEHFLNSGFTNKDLAVLAYENAPAEYRQPFDEAVEDMNQLILNGLSDIHSLIDSDNTGGELETLVNDLCGKLRGLVDRCSGIIHGKVEGAVPEAPSAAESQAAHSEPAAVQTEDEDEAVERVDQAAIDALFD